MATIIDPDILIREAGIDAIQDPTERAAMAAWARWFAERVATFTPSLCHLPPEERAAIVESMRDEVEVSGEPGYDDEIDDDMEQV